MNIAPILRIRGKVRQINDRTVPAVAALAERRDDDGTFYPAREARPAYSVRDLVIDTDPGGLVAVVITPAAEGLIGGWTPSVGDTLDLPVRGYQAWNGRPGKRYSTNGYSLAGDVFKAEGLGSDTGRRVAAVS